MRDDLSRLMVALIVLCGGSRCARSLSGTADPHDRALRRRRTAGYEFATGRRELSKQIGQQVVVDNRPGASSSIGFEAVAKRAAGWLYDRIWRVSARHQSEPARESSVRCKQGFPDGDPDEHLTQCHRHHARPAREFGTGTDRLTRSAIRTSCCSAPPAAAARCTSAWSCSRS